jgi:hypothetical protein
MARASGDRLQGRIEATLGLATALATLSPTIATTPKPTKSLERASFRVFNQVFFIAKNLRRRIEETWEVM